jgi:hypothetical protein
MRSQYLESSPLQQSYIDVALASSCNKIPVESFVKETVSAGSFASMGKAIVEYVDSRRATLLVMRSRGMGAWTSSLAGNIGLGSVSDYVTHHARTPYCWYPPYTATLPSIHSHELPRYPHLPQHHHTPHITPFTPPLPFAPRWRRGFRSGRREAQRAVDLLRCSALIEGTAALCR